MQAISNKGINYSYEILDKYEAGLVLYGPEVKSVKAGHVQFKNAYIKIVDENTAEIVGLHISPYALASSFNNTYDPDRPRNLLLHKKEIRYLLGRSKEGGLSVVPLRIYSKGGYIKLSIALARGRKKHDKREYIKDRDFQLQKRGLLKNYLKN